MKILFAGTPHNAADTLASLSKSGAQIVAVLTRPDAPVGRNRILSPSPVAQVALQLGIPVIKANQVDAEVLHHVLSYQPDLGVVVAYGAILKKFVLDALPIGWINLHYSLLPKYRGAAPVQHAILNGELETGVTVFQLDSGLDTGEVLLQVPTRIEPDENAGLLLDRLSKLGVSALNEVLPKLASGLISTQSQTHSDSSSAPKISRAQAQITWHDSASNIENLIRAMNPEPMAWTTLDQDPLRILDGRAIAPQVAGTTIEGFQDGSPGNVHHLGGRVIVSCGHSVLEIRTVQPAGKKPMPANDWFRGHNLKGKIVLGT